jgi:two-component system chemotaxis sensor kinase CheA
MQEKEMINDLIQESREHLQEIEPVLLELEKKGNDISTDMINQIFRAVHSIKGGFGFFGFKQITSLSHSMENILSKVRDKNLTITMELIDALFKGIDKLRVIFDDFENADSISIEAELNALAPFRDDKPEVSDGSNLVSEDSKSETLHYHSALPMNLIDEAVSNGKTIYRIILNSQKDLEARQITISGLFEKWERLGKIIDFTLDLDCITGLHGSSQAEMIYSVIFASVLEPELILMGLNVISSQVRIINPELLKDTTAQKATTTETAAPVIAKTQQNSESKAVDDSLRVKVQVLNNLMNLAGELVLSRNQLMQQFNRKLIDALDQEKTNDEFSRISETSLKNINDCCRKNPDQLNQVVVSEFSLLKDLFTKILSIPLKELNGAAITLQSIDSVTSQLQENIMQTRLQPVSVVFGKFPRVIRDLSRKLEKQIELSIVGQDVELDKSIVELLSDPLTHLVRNCADHGIELPEVRKKAGKNPTGTIYLSAFQEGGKVIVEIEDDGHGLDTELIKKSAIAKRLITEQAANSMSVREIQLLIMQPGFSTAKEVTDISGRGVGMDVVKSNIERLGGTINIESEEGRGMTISLTLPLTLAIIPSLIISSEDRTFAIPQVGVEELVRIRSFEVVNKIERIQGAEVTRLRGKLLPLVRLSELLHLVPSFVHPVTKEHLPDQRARWSDRRGVPENADLPPTPEQTAEADRRTGNRNRRVNVSNAVKIVVVKSGINHYGLIVDSVFDSEEIVVKPLPEYFKSTQVYAGATILGDGKVAMILDPGGIAIKAGLRFSDLEKEQLKEQQKYTQKISEKTEEILLFDNGSSERFGLDLKTVARIEKAELAEIEHIGSNEFIKRDGSSFPLIRIHEYLPVSTPGAVPETFFIILPKFTDRKIGIIAESVYDVVDTALTLDTRNIKGTGVMGSTIINNRLTIVLDMKSLLTAVEQRLGN